jgi:FkbM family methyltransferase
MWSSEKLKGTLPESLLGAVRQARARSRQLMHWSGRELRHTLPCGICVSIASPSDWEVYNELFVDGEYDPAIRAVTESDVTAPLIVDLGANGGFFALRFADLWRRTRGDRPFRLVAVEGAPRTYAQLTRHLDQAALSGQCVARHGLAGRRTGSAWITTSAHTGLNSIRTRQSFSRANVSFIDLDALLPPGRAIDLMKCDIEGAEEMLCESYPDLLHRVRILVIEFHDALNDVDRCRRLLHAAGLVHQHSSRAYEGGSVEMFSRAPLRRDARLSG